MHAKRLTQKTARGKPDSALFRHFLDVIQKNKSYFHLKSIGPVPKFETNETIERNLILTSLVIIYVCITNDEM